jgi:hypothetical protein
MDERGGHKDLCGSDRWSVIPYVHGRTELYCSSMPCMSLPFLSAPTKRCLPWPFITQGRLDYNETRSPTGGPEVVETLYNI